MFECGDGKWLHIMPPGPDLTPLMQTCLAEIGAERVAEANASVGDAPAMMTRAFPNLGANQIAFKRRPREQWLDDCGPTTFLRSRSQLLGKFCSTHRRRPMDRN